MTARAGLADTLIPSHWLQAEQIINIFSITAATLSIPIALAVILKDKKQLNRASLRLSITIAIFSTIYSICRLIALDIRLITQPKSILHLLLWFTWASHLTVILLSTIVCLHLLVTLLGKTRWAFRLLSFYELLAFSVAFLATHPAMYVFREVGWDVENKSWLLDGKLPLYGGKSWGIYLAWISLCIVASLSILIHVYFIGSRRAVGDKHLSANTLSQSVSSIGSSGVWDGVAGNRGSVDQGTAGLRRMALRNAGFAFVPLVTGLSSVVCAMAPHRVGWLYGLALVMAATQGVLCLAMLAVNVEMDRLLRVLVGGRPGKTAEPKPSEVELHLDFARLDNTSTIHLSPYQSRGSSIS